MMAPGATVPTYTPFVTPLVLITSFEANIRIWFVTQWETFRIRIPTVLSDRVGNRCSKPPTVPPNFGQ